MQQGPPVLLRLWDVGGESGDGEVRAAALRSASVALLCFDCTDASSLAEAVAIGKQMRDMAASAATQMWLLALKSDGEGSGSDLQAAAEEAAAVLDAQLHKVSSLRAPAIEPHPLLQQIVSQAGEAGLLSNHRRVRRLQGLWDAGPHGAAPLAAALHAIFPRSSPALLTVVKAALLLPIASVLALVIGLPWLLAARLTPSTAKRLALTAFFSVVLLPALYLLHSPMGVSVSALLLLAGLAWAGFADWKSAGVDADDGRPLPAAQTAVVAGVEAVAIVCVPLVTLALPAWTAVIALWLCQLLAVAALFTLLCRTLLRRAEVVPLAACSALRLLRLAPAFDAPPAAAWPGLLLSGPVIILAGLLYLPSAQLGYGLPALALASLLALMLSPDAAPSPVGAALRGMAPLKLCYVIAPVMTTSDTSTLLVRLFALLLQLFLAVLLDVGSRHRLRSASAALLSDARAERRSVRCAVGLSQAGLVAALVANVLATAEQLASLLPLALVGILSLAFAMIAAGHCYACRSAAAGGHALLEDEDDLRGEAAEARGGDSADDVRQWETIAVDVEDGEEEEDQEEEGKEDEDDA
eukprot:PLAT11400.2.p1 GENE.PLAT11400.2~~PLAT11400.2.p1  ORF type:complete len:644 (-),score=298.62 PLAT11400.2:49-1794(-)